MASLQKTVNVQQLSHQLTREIKRNPAKAAVLGGLLVVAVWFWFPLVQGWLGLASSSSSDDESIVVASTTQAASTPSSVSPLASKMNWRTIARRISEDPWMQSGQLRSKTFDPFYPKQPIPTQFTATDTPPETAPIPDVSPEAAGLSITSVIAGGTVPIARINNLNYRIGDQVPAQDGQLHYTVIAVKPWGVLLQGARQTYELHLDHLAPKQGQRMVMRNGTVISPDN